VLCLDGEVDARCAAAEYAGCPRRWPIDDLGGDVGAAPIETAFTLLPCAPALAGSAAAVAIDVHNGAAVGRATVAAATAIELASVVPDLAAGGGARTVELRAAAAEDAGFVAVVEDRRRLAGAVSGHTAVSGAASGAAAALLTYPYLRVDTASGVDTIIQLSNDGSAAISARCVYEDQTPTCVGGAPEQHCVPDASACAGVCEIGYAAQQFAVTLAPGQTRAWSVGRGDAQGGGAPGVADPFVGSLRCVAGGRQGDASAARDVLRSAAAITTATAVGAPAVDAARYAAFGLRARAAAPADDAYLVIGGPSAEYEACPGVLGMSHVLDGAIVRSGMRRDAVETTLAVVPCSADPGLGAAAAGVLQFLVRNEYAQRFSTSRGMRGQFVQRLALIETSDPRRSIFHAGVAGTLSAHTAIQRFADPNGGSGAGLIGIATQAQGDPDGTERPHTAAVELAGAGASAGFDLLALAPSTCAADCDGDGAVGVAELMLAVNIALGTQPTAACTAADVEGDGAVTVSELLRGIGALLNGCGSAAPTPLPEPTPVPSVAPTELGPELTHFGLASADDVVLAPVAFDGDGRPVFTPPHGQGFTLLVEARRGLGERPVGRSAYDASGMRPDLQVIVSRPLGDGSATVCDVDAPVIGGVAAAAPFGFDSPNATAVINDLGCRASASANSTRGDGGCARRPNGVYAFLDPRADAQFCIPVAAAWAFPPGDTMVAARVRDASGTDGPERQIVVRVLGAAD